MTSLGEIANIESNIKNSAIKAVKALHVVAFGEEGQPRRIRRNLRNFSGFNLDENSEEFKGKIDDVLSKLELPDLIAACHVLNLDYSGRDEDIATRICLYLNKLTNEDVEDERQDDIEDENNADGPLVNDDEQDTNSDDSLSRHFQRSLKSTNEGRRRNQVQEQTDKSFALTFRDVEDSIRPFDGKEGYPVGKWIEDFEEIAELMGWNELQKLIFAKKSLRGIAKLFVQAEKGIKTWNMLKKLLKDEFEMKVSSAEIHRTLMRRKKQKEESVQEYVLTMREIGSRADIESEALMQYIIDGIVDDPANKVVLYGAKTFNEFKEKIKLYEKIKSKNQGYASRGNTSYNSIDKGKKQTKTEEGKSGNDISRKPTQSTNHCFNCGMKGHKSRDCPSKQKGTKCFRCNEYGHISNNCPKKTTSRTTDSESSQTNVAVNSIVRNNMVNITVNDFKMSALFDTGSDINVIREDIFRNHLNDIPLMQNSISISGIGGNQIKTLGSFTTDAIVSDENFNLTFHVVPRNASNFEAIIGNPLLAQAEVFITIDGMIIHKLKEKNFMMQINLIEDDNKLDINHIQDPVIKETIQDMVKDYKPEKTETTGIEMKIVLSSEEPIYESPRRLPLPEKKEVERQISEWLEEGIIRPSSSDFASPVVLVRKKDGSYRICVDYRKLNKKVIKDRFPLPLIDDVLDKLQGALVFSTIDLKNGFFHVPVEESSRKYTSFVTHSGQFEFCKTPFGLCNSPSVFQRFVSQVFRPLINKDYAILYMDDIIVPSRDEVEGLERLKLVFDTARKYGLEPKFKKCQFLRTRVEFLGHIIEKGTIRPTKEKTSAVQNFPVPTTTKQVQSFLGLTGYFRKYIPSYSQIAKPLSDLLKNGSMFVFGIEQQQAFEKLKAALMTNPVLNIYRQDARTELHVDASKYGFGSTLLQEGEDGKLHPVYFMSRKTTPAQEKLHSYELEVMAIIESIKKFRIYLLGIKFKIVTDCEAFKKTMDKKDLTTRVARWALLLEEFDYEIEHRKGERMKHVDALSRYPAVMTVENVVLRQIQGAQQQDSSLKAIIKILEHETYDDYVLENGTLYKEQDGDKLLVIPKSLQTEIIRTAHEPGHFGAKKTESLINKNYFIPKVRKKVEEYIASCVSCILGNRKQGKQEGLLNPIPKQSVPLDTYHLDHCGPFQSTKKNYRYILLMIDAFTKFTWIFPTKSLSAKEVLDKLRLNQVIFGNPRKIITDRGGAFRAQEFKDYCATENIEHIEITTGVPRGNGQVERMVQTVTSALRRLSYDDPTTWYKHVTRLQHAINSSYNRSTNNNPFRLMFGVDIKKKEDLDIYKIVQEIEREIFEEEREELRENAKMAIEKMQDENVKSFNKKRKSASKYQLNDIVAIKRTQFGTQNKLFPKFLGPYRISRVKGKDRYDVERIGKGEGPKVSSTSADGMKPWQTLSDNDDTSGSDDLQDGRAVGFTG